MSFEIGTLGLKYDVLHFSFHLLPLSEFIVCTFFFMLKRSWDWISRMQWRGLCDEICRLRKWKYLHFNTDFVVIYGLVKQCHYELNSGIIRTELKLILSPSLFIFSNII